MPRNGSGTYSLPAGNPVTTGTTISSTWANGTLSDLASAMTSSIAKDGQTTPTANLPMGTYRHTGVGNGVAATDYTALGQAQNDAFTLIGSIAGVDTITGALTPTLTAYAAGQAFKFVSAGANTGAVTINIDSVGAVAITKNGATALAAGDIPSGAAVFIVNDGTRFQLQNPATTTKATNLAGGSAGTIPYQSAADTTAMLAAGTSGQVLTSGGAAAPTWTTPTSVGLVKLNSGTVSAAATLDIVMTSYTAYKNKKLVLESLVPATDGVSLQLYVSTNGGVSYDSGAHEYSWAINIVNDSTAATYGQSSDDTTIVMTNGFTVGNATTEGISGEIFIPHMTNAALWPTAQFELSYISSDAAPRYTSINGGGTRRAAQDTDAIRLKFNSGNIETGAWVLYGYN